MINLILFGKPGSGKGTQAEFVKKRYDLVHISTGDVFRHNISKNTDLGLLAKSYMEKGDLVPDQIIMSIIEKRLSKPDCNNGFILDGFPRTLNQAIELDKILKKHQIDIDKIIEIDVEEENLIQRITTRALETNNSRDDDNSNVLKNRIEIYKKDTKPVLNFYSNMDKLITINGMLSIDEVSEEILNSL